jgi:ankyrin repeat protein
MGLPYRLAALTAWCAAFGFAARAASPIADLAEAGRWAEAQRLVTSGSDVDEPQADGTTALVWAAHHRRTEAARWLLDAGANVSATNEYGVSALTEAATAGDAELLDLLLSAGAEPNTAMPEGDTALMLAARSGSEAAVERLLEAGATVDARDAWHGETALMWAAGENHAAVVRLLLQRGADVRMVSTEFNWDYVKQTGVASALPRGGLTALLHAAREDSLESAAALLDHGANPNDTDPRGLSALRVAITNNNLDLAKLLLERGADANEGALVEIVKLRTHPWVRAAKERRDTTTQLELMEALLARGADIHYVPKTGMVKQFWVDGDHPNEPPLYLAAQSADLELMKLLAERGATAARSLSQKGASILMAATGLTPHAGAGATPIDRPAEIGLEAGRLALSLGADVHTARKDGMTALHLAAEKGWNEIAQFLIEEGAKLDVRDWSGRLPIDVAKGVAAIPMPDDPPMPPRPPPVHEDTAALLRAAMAAAGVAEAPYVAPKRSQ